MSTSFRVGEMRQGTTLSLALVKELQAFDQRRSECMTAAGALIAAERPGLAVWKAVDAALHALFG